MKRLVIQITASAPDHTVSWYLERAEDKTCWYVENEIYYRTERRSHRSEIETIPDNQGVKFANARLIELADDGYKVQKNLSLI